MNTRPISSASQPGMPVTVAPWVDRAPPVTVTSLMAPVGQAGNDPINWWLISLAIGYALLSYIWLAPSIWVRLVFASFLILRMRPDIVIPYFISCLQLRLNFKGGLEDAIDFGASDLTVGLTGFESYAFAIPPLLISVRTAFAAVDKRVDRSHFPNWLYGIWSLGGILVLVGTFMILGTSRGWTGAVRLYSIVGSVFYGMLMPRMTSRQVDRLAAGMAYACLMFFATALAASFGGKLVFVLGPVGAFWATTQLASGTRLILATTILLATGYVSLFLSTLCVFGTWVWSVIAACIAHVTRRRGVSMNRVFRAYVSATIVLCAVMFFFGVTRNITENQRHDQTLLGRIEYKLYADRGPIWWGCIRSLMEEPSLMPTPERAFPVEWLGFEQSWTFGPHNLVLELLNQLGMVAGPIAIAVMAYAVRGCVAAVGRDPNIGVRTLAAAAICSIVVGGLTLPYCVGDRLGENVLIPAGLAIANSWGLYGNPLRARGIERG